MRPTVSPPISVPSYRFCAVRIVRVAALPGAFVPDAGGPPPAATGLVQEVVCRGVNVRIQYGAFEDAAAAHTAALQHIAGVSAAFRTGLWSRAQAAAIGDESWWVRDRGGQALLIRCGNVCALVGCREGDPETRDRVAEDIAARIAAKAHAARRLTLAVPPPP